jgi:hypothetical protein
MLEEGKTMVRATLRAKQGECVSVINLSCNTGKDVDTYLVSDGKTVFDVMTDDLLDDAQYGYILRDHRDGIVYAIEGFELDFLD